MGPEGGRGLVTSGALPKNGSFGPGAWGCCLYRSVQLRKRNSKKGAYTSKRSWAALSLLWVRWWRSVGFSSAARTQPRAFRCGQVCHILPPSTCMTFRAAPTFLPPSTFITFGEVPTLHESTESWGRSNLATLNLHGFRGSARVTQMDGKLRVVKSAIFCHPQLSWLSGRCLRYTNRRNIEGG